MLSVLGCKFQLSIKARNGRARGGFLHPAAHAEPRRAAAPAPASAQPPCAGSAGTVPADTGTAARPAVGGWRSSLGGLPGLPAAPGDSGGWGLAGFQAFQYGQRQERRSRRLSGIRSPVVGSAEPRRGRWTRAALLFAHRSPPERERGGPGGAGPRGEEVMGLLPATPGRAFAHPWLGLHHGPGAGAGKPQAASRVRWPAAAGPDVCFWTRPGPVRWIALAAF